MRYKKAPIIESICEFRFSADSRWDNAMPGLIYGPLREEFPNRTQAIALQARVQEVPDGIEQQIAGVDRIRFARQDATALVQVGAHFLAINHVAPYPGWPAFRPLIDKALAAYREVADPTGIQRIGLRYINSFPFAQGEVFEHESLFNFYPHLGPDLPQRVSTFVCGVTYNHDGELNLLRLQASTALAPDLKQPAINLDLDYFTNTPLGVSFDTVHEWLETAHRRIEDTFEGAITEKLRQTLEPEA